MISHGGHDATTATRNLQKYLDPLCASPGPDLTGAQRRRNAMQGYSQRVSGNETPIIRAMFRNPKSCALLPCLNDGMDHLNHQHGPYRHDNETKDEGPNQSLVRPTVGLTC